MIPLDDIHKATMNTKWRSHEMRGMSRPADGEENRRRLRESRINPDDLVNEIPAKLSAQALAFVSCTSSTTPQSAPTPPSIEQPPPPADTSTINTNALDGTVTENIDGR
jgi:hypothetical protein